MDAEDAAPGPGLSSPGPSGPGAQGPPELLDQGALAALAAHEALGSRWHLAVLSGPDAGLVLPAGGERSIGRDGVLSDPLISRRHLRTRERDRWLLVRDRGSANGTRRRVAGFLWLPLRGEARLAQGARLRLGASELELRRRPASLAVPAPPAPQSTTWMLVTSLLLVALMVGAGAIALRTGSRGAMGMVMLAPMALMAVMRLLPLLQARAAARREGGRADGGRHVAAQPGWRSGRPDPPTMLLALAARGVLAPGGRAGARADAAGGSGQGGAADTGPGHGGARSGAAEGRDCLRAWTDHAQRRGILALRDGDCLALSGPAGHDALAWWCAQVLARASARVRLRPGGVVLAWGSPARECTASLLVAHRDEVPAEALSVRPAPHQAPSCTPVWWRAACHLQGLQPGSGPGGPGGPGDPPDAVLLSQLIEELDADELAERWAADGLSHPGCPPHLEAVLGVGAQGALSADLVAQGPHALLAGTTGSGKSELLVAWLLQLALGTAPSRLSLILVDYKGGAAFGPLVRLPHTAGVLTDLDPAATLRALSSLEAEVRRRERLLALHGAKDIAHLPPPVVVPRLVVAVDEFATMAAEHAEVLGALVRVAAQGRSLGIHLILSTQRPQGAVSPAMRANTALRVCLRVLDAGDSRDVVGHDGAARLPRHPGRVLVGAAGAQEDGSHQVLQAPWCGAGDEVEAMVGLISRAARGGPAPWRPWAPALPSRVDAVEAEAIAAGRPGGTGGAGDAGGAGGASGGAGPARGVVLALTDLPEEQRLGIRRWGLDTPLVVLGSPGSGRSTALASIALQAAGTGTGVHLCGAPGGVLRAAAESGGGPERAGMSGPGGQERLGTAVGPEDPRRLVRLWSLAVSGALAGDLLCLDDVDALLPAVDEALGPGEGHALLESLIRAAGASGTRLALSAPLASASARWAAGIGLRLVLGACSAAQASLAGLPHGMVTGRGPGRGVLLHGGAATACQAVLPPPLRQSRAPSPPLRTGRPGPMSTGSSRIGSPPLGAGGSPGPVPLRLEPLPRILPADGLPPGTWAVGGDRATAVPLEEGVSVLVVGPAGSGRSSALAALRRALARTGSPTPDHRQSGVGEPRGGRGGAAGVGDGLLVVDDLDRADPGVQAQVEAALGRGDRVLASATTDKAASSYRGPLAVLRERGAVLVLWPGMGPAAQAAGMGLRAATDPRAPTLPGRGVLVHRGVCTPLQVVAPARAPAPRPTLEEPCGESPRIPPGKPLNTACEDDDRVTAQVSPQDSCPVPRRV